jgi:hypothetical protein
MIEDQLCYDPQATPVSLLKKNPEVLQGPIVGVNVGIVRDVVAIILQWGRIKGKQPQSGDTEILKIIQLPCEPFEVSYTVAVSVGESPDVELINDGVLIPERIVV